MDFVETKIIAKRAFNWFFKNDFSIGKNDTEELIIDADDIRDSIPDQRRTHNMTKYRIIWNGEPLETRFNTRSEAERFATERYDIEKSEIDENQANECFGDDYPEYEIESYETSVLEEWKRDLKYSLDPYIVNPYDSITPPFDDTNHPSCPYCSATMDFYDHDDSGDLPSGEGFWKCPDCDFSISEDEL